MRSKLLEESIIEQVVHLFGTKDMLDKRLQMLSVVVTLPSPLEPSAVGFEAVLRRILTDSEDNETAGACEYLGITDRPYDELSRAATSVRSLHAKPLGVDATEIDKKRHGRALMQYVSVRQQLVAQRLSVTTDRQVRNRRRDLAVALLSALDRMFADQSRMQSIALEIGIDRTMTTTRPADARAVDDSPLVVRSEVWLPRLRTGNCGEALLRASATRESVGHELVVLEETVKKAPLHGKGVQVTTMFRSRTYQVTSVSQLWAIMLSDLVLSRDASRHGDRKWFIEETRRIVERKRSTAEIEADSDPAVDRVKDVWTWLIKTYCVQESPSFTPHLFQGILDDAVAKSEYQYRLLGYFGFILNIVMDMPALVGQLVDTLRRCQGQLGSRARHFMGRRIDELISKGIAAIEPAPYTGREFKPALVRVVASSICPYDFDAMRLPLTGADVSHILGVELEIERKESVLPYIFSIGEVQNFSDFYGSLGKKVSDIVDSCNLLAPNRDEVWDVPTIAEWVALAGCQVDPFPWGASAPTPGHANLSFGGAGSVQPVGLNPKGTSKTGAGDCCGNVHEIVRLGVDADWFPDSYRLAGGCYQTTPERASCHTFRPFEPKRRRELRRNVGLRLVRIRSNEMPQRAEGARACRELDFVDVRDARQRPWLRDWSS